MVESLKLALNFFLLSAFFFLILEGEGEGERYVTVTVPPKTTSTGRNSQSIFGKSADFMKGKEKESHSISKALLRVLMGKFISG